jgi:hypothetical protein
MADLLQSSTTAATTTPTFYTNYLSDLASKGTAAGNAATAGSSAWDPNALQNQAYGNATANVGNYQPRLATAGQTLSNAAGTNVSGATQPYLNAGTTTSGLSQANPYLSSGMAQNTGASAANPYLASGTSTNGLSQANPYLQAGSQGADQLIGNYMNPYTKDVVNQIGAANQQNIAQNLSPGITAGAVGSGQFGSQRGANALSLGISNANIGALSQQTAALQSGYAQALAAAQAQRTNQLTAGATAGNLQSQFNTNQVNAGNIAGNLQNQQATNALTAGATAGQLQGQYNTNLVSAGQVAGNAANQQGQLGVAASQQQANQAQQLQNQGLADTNALSTLGGQKQALAQAKVYQPLDVLGKQASIMSGAQLPTTTTQTSQASPLSAIAGLGTTAAGLFQTGTNGQPSAGTNILNGLGSLATSAYNGINNYFYPTPVASYYPDYSVDGYGQNNNLGSL